MPAGSEAPVSLPHRFRPLGVRVAAIVGGVLLTVVALAVWYSFTDEVRAQFTLAQNLSIAAMVVGGAACGHALARSRLDADADGLTVVNGYRARRYEWTEILAVTLRPGSPWAVLDLSDGTTVSAMGIQGSDGARATRQVRLLRELVEHGSGSGTRGAS